MRRIYPHHVLREGLVWFLLMILFSGTVMATGDGVPNVSKQAISPVDTLFHQPLSRGIDLVYQDRFEESLTIFDSLQQAFPHHPAPYFYKAAAYQSWMSSYRINHFKEKLKQNIEKAIEIGNDLLDEREDDPWLNFYIGAAYGYRAFYKFRDHDWIGAYFDGKKGISNFKKALEKDSTLYDVYLGLGNYHYWRTAKSKFIRIVAFWMSDKRGLGIRQMDFASEHGRYAVDEANFALVNALYDYEKYQRAMEELKQYHTRGDKQIISELYVRGRLLVKFEEWTKAGEIFAEILHRLEAHPYPSIGFQVECKYWIAQALYENDQPVEAYKLADDALQQSEERDKDTELEGQFESFDKIKDHLEDFYDDLKEEIELSGDLSG